MLPEIIWFEALLQKDCQHCYERIPTLLLLYFQTLPIETGFASGHAAFLLSR